MEESYANDARTHGGHNAGLYEADLLADSAKLVPGVEMQTVKHSKDPAMRLARMLRERGLVARTEVWYANNGKRRKQNTKRRVLFYYPSPDGDLRELPILQATPRGYAQAEAQEPTQEPPDIVIGHTRLEAMSYCRERSWNSMKLAAGPEEAAERIPKMIKPTIIDLRGES